LNGEAQRGRSRGFHGLRLTFPAGSTVRWRCSRRAWNWRRRNPRIAFRFPRVSGSDVRRTTRIGGVRPRWPTRGAMHLTAPPGGRIRQSGDAVEGLSEGFRLHDLRHTTPHGSSSAKASMWRGSRSPFRHASARTTLDVYGRAPTVKSPHELPLRKCWQLVRTLWAPNGA